MISSLFRKSFGKMALVAFVLAGLGLCGGCASTAEKDALSARAAASMVRVSADRLEKDPDLAASNKYALEEARKRGAAADAAVDAYNNALEELAKAKKAVINNAPDYQKRMDAQQAVDVAAAELKRASVRAYNAADYLEDRLAGIPPNPNPVPPKSHAEGEDFDNVIRDLTTMKAKDNRIVKEPGDPY